MRWFVLPVIYYILFVFVPVVVIDIPLYAPSMIVCWCVFWPSLPYSVIMDKGHYAEPSISHYTMDY